MKTYRGNMQSVDPQDALLSLDAFCRKYEAFLCDLLKVTSRPTSKMLCDATAKVWPGQSPLEHKTFNNHVSEVVKVLFGKARSMTTGQRLPDSVSSMCKFIRATILDPNVSASPGKRQLAIMDDPGDSPKPVLPCKRPNPGKSKRVLKEHISLSSGTGSEAPDLQVAKAVPAASASAKKQKHILPKAEPPGSDIASRYAGSSSSTSALHGSVVYHVDMSVPTVWRISGDSRQQATLKPGPLGFAVATWGDQERSTEIPNLVLEKRAQYPAKEAAGKPQPAAKKKAGSKAKAKAKSKVACKKPATVLQDAQDSESAEEAPAGAPAGAPEDAVKPTERLRKEYRSATNSVSIRAIWRDDEHKEKKRQLFELRGLDAISKEKLLELAEESCAKILEGQDEATVKSWALDELNKRKNV